MGVRYNCYKQLVAIRLLPKWGEAMCLVAIVPNGCGLSWRIALAGQENQIKDVRFLFSPLVVASKTRIQRYLYREVDEIWRYRTGGNPTTFDKDHGTAEEGRNRGVRYDCFLRAESQRGEADRIPNFATSAAKLVCRASRKGFSTWPGLEPRPTSNSELWARFWSYRQNSLVQYGFWRQMYRNTNGIVLSKVTCRVNKQ